MLSSPPKLPYLWRAERWCVYLKSSRLWNTSAFFLYIVPRLCGKLNHFKHICKNFFYFFFSPCDDWQRQTPWHADSFLMGSKRGGRIRGWQIGLHFVDFFPFPACHLSTLFVFLINMYAPNSQPPLIPFQEKKHLAPCGGKSSWHPHSAAALPPPSHRELHP